MAKVPPFSDLIAATTRSAVHLETAGHLRRLKLPEYQEWLAGTPRPVPASPEWFALRPRAHGSGRPVQAGAHRQRAAVGLHPVRARGDGRAERRGRRRGPLAATQASPRSRRCPSTTTGCLTTGWSGSGTSPGTGRTLKTN